MNSSLAYTANQRVERYRKSVEFIAEDVLLYKGFLGRTLKERDGLPTVGARAARAAGVIVDSLGKLRCPPGTPNANQFTDLQMSNCMVPGLGAAQRLAREAANSTQGMLQRARDIMKSTDGKKKVKGVARVAAMAGLVALDTLDYMQVDGSGSLSASSLALAEILRYGSSRLAEAALDRLERKGKITKNQRKNLDAILDKVATTERFGGVAEYLTGRAEQALTRRRRMKPTRRDNRVPDVDLTVEDIGLPLETPIDSYKPKLKTGNRAIDNVAGAPPVNSNRNLDRLTQVTADADALSAEIAQKKKNLLNKYVPGKENEPVETFADELMQKMGIKTDKPFKEQLDEAMDFFLKTGEQDAIDDMTPDHRLSATQNEVNRIKGLSKKETWEKCKTEEGKKQVREAMAEGYLEVLVGAEIATEKNPSLRNKTEMRIHKFSDPQDLNEFAGYAKTEIQKDGTVSLVCTLVPNQLPFDQRSIHGAEGTDLAKGQSMSIVLRFAGADDYQMGLGIHEYAHLEHFASQFAASGLVIGNDAPPLSSQMQGALGETIIGMQFARSHNFSPDTTWDEVKEKLNIVRSGKNTPEAGDIVRVHDFYGSRSLDEEIYHVAEKFAQTSRIKQQRKDRGMNPDERRVGEKLKEELRLGLTAGRQESRIDMLADLIDNLDSYDSRVANPFAGMNPQNLTEQQKQNIIANIRMSPPRLWELVDDTTGKEVTPDDVRKILADVFEGQSPKEFLANHKRVMDEVFGIDTDFISTNGVPTDEIMSVLGRSSEYGKTNMMEAVAEARTLTTLAERFKDSISVKQMEEVEKMRQMLDKVIPPRSAGVAQRNLTPEAKEHFARIARMLGRLPSLKLGELRV